MSNYKPFKVDFKFTVNDSASMYLIAETPEAAADGAMQMLKQDAERYSEPEITGVAEFKIDPPEAPTFN